MKMTHLIKLLLLLKILMSNCDLYYDDEDWIQGRSKSLSEDEKIDVHEKWLEVLITSGYRPTQLDPAYPVVSIRTSKETEFFGDNHFCAGAIVGYRMVVTAAHCLVDSHNIQTRPERIIVVIGTTNRLRKTEHTVERAVTDIFVHPQYKRKDRHDIAVLNLDVEIPFANPFIRILRVVKKRPLPGSRCQTIGWGQLLYMGPSAADVVFVDLEVLDISACEKHFGRKFHDSSLCVGDFGTAARGACRGESGSPLICGELFAGIVSYGTHCGNGRNPSVFTDVNSHRDWFYSIESTQVRLTFYAILIYSNALIVNFF